MIYSLLDPLVISLVVFVAQALIWWFLMPDIPSIPAAAPKHVSDVSIDRYLIFLGVWVIALIWGRALSANAPRKEVAPSPRMIEYLIKAAKVAVGIAAFGEIIYLRVFISDPAVLIENFQRGYLSGVGGAINQEGVTGISSLVNVWLAPTAIFAALAFNPLLSSSTRRSARKWLWGLGIWSFFQAIVVSARMLFIVFLVILTVSYLIQGGRRKQVQQQIMRIVLGVLVAFVLVVWLGETLRSGYYYATLTGKSAFSPQVQRVVTARLVEGYFSAEFNNAQILLDCPPSMTFVRSAVSLTTVAHRLFGLPMDSYDYYCSDFVSSYGTVNIFGNWWFDAGWFGLVYALILGAWLSYTYHSVIRQPHALTFNFLFLLLAFPGIISLTRINYFGLTLFLLPALFLSAAWIFSPRKKRVEAAS
jgi:hypothetical protein